MRRSDGGSGDGGQGSVIVTCERCGTQFQLDDARVPKRGVRVRCSRCKNAFRVVPEGERGAEEIAELARRAREDSREETTQDLAEDSRGDSSSRARSRRGSDARSADAAKASESGAAGAGGLLEEESDWKFNEDVSGVLDGRGGSGRDAQGKPDPPEAVPARSGAQNADDWFSGGSDAPLELDDRPRGESAGVGAEALEQADPAPAPPEFLAAPRPAHEAPVMAPAFAAAEAPAPSRPADPTPTDELRSESWDLLGEAEAAESEALEEKDGAESEPERKSAPWQVFPALADAAARVVQWIGYGANALGWVVTCALFGAGLYTGLAPTAPLAPTPERVVGLELAALEGRFVENATSGALFVVSGRLRNPGPGTAALQPLELELLDAAGQALGAREALHAPAPTVLLREAPAIVLSEMPRLAGAIAAGEERPFEVVLASLPAEAASFRIVESRGARAPEALPATPPAPAP